MRRVLESDLERDPPAHAVADQMGAIELQRVEQGRDRVGLELRGS